MKKLANIGFFESLGQSGCAGCDLSVFNSEVFVNNATEGEVYRQLVKHLSTFDRAQQAALESYLCDGIYDSPNDIPWDASDDWTINDTFFDCPPSENYAMVCDRELSEADKKAIDEEMDGWDVADIYRAAGGLPGDYVILQQSYNGDWYFVKWPGWNSFESIAKDIMDHKEYFDGSINPRDVTTFDFEDEEIQRLLNSID